MIVKNVGDSIGISGGVSSTPVIGIERVIHHGIEKKILFIEQNGNIIFLTEKNMRDMLFWACGNAKLIKLVPNV
jgi:hypothetical protein